MRANPAPTASRGRAGLAARCDIEGEYWIDPDDGDAQLARADGCPTNVCAGAADGATATGYFRLAPRRSGRGVAWRPKMKLLDVSGAPYGASTMSGGDGSLQPSTTERDGGRFHGKYVAEIVAKLTR